MLSPLAILIIALSMSADAFAAAIARGAVERPGVSQALRAGLVFGMIETLTPIAGWALGRAASGFVESVDHWIAFGLLAAVGLKMTWEGSRRGGEEMVPPSPGRGGTIALVATAIGTSIDAAAVGVTLALVGANIFVIALAIGSTTFILATAGMLIGRSAGVRLGGAVEVIGGIALIGLGTKILLDHLGYLG